MKKALLIFALCLTSGLSCFAQDTGATKTTKPDKTKMEDTTPEQRSRMASVHEKMATCLRSTKTMQECHDEMTKECPTGDGCMMGMGKKHSRMEKHRYDKENEKKETK